MAILLADLFSEGTLNALVQLGAVGLLALAIVLLFRGGAVIINRFLDIQDRLTTAIEKIEGSESKQVIAINDVVTTNREVVGITRDARDSNLALIAEIKLSRKSQDDHQTAIIETITEVKNSIETTIKEIDSRSKLETIESQLKELIITVQKAIQNCGKTTEIVT